MKRLVSRMSAGAALVGSLALAVGGGGLSGCVSGGGKATAGGNGGAGTAGGTGGRGGEAVREPRGGGATNPADGARTGASGAALSNVQSSQVRERALTALAAATMNPAAEQRANAVEALVPVPTRLEPVVRRLVKDPNLAVRAIAATAAGKARLVGSKEFVRPLLSDESAMVRMGAIYALARCGEAVDQTPLAGWLRSPEPLVRAQAAFLLGEIHNTSALAMIREAARDAMPRADVSQVRLMRLQMAEAMIKLGDEGAIDEIRAALYPARPEDLEATALAAQILGEVKDRGAVAQLYALMDSFDAQAGRMPAEIRLAAAGSLGALGANRAVARLSGAENGGGGGAAARMNGGGGLNGGGATPMIEVADEYRAAKSGPLRAQAAIVYGQSGRREVLGVLGEMLNDPDPLVGIAAAAAVLKITDGAER